MKKRVLPACTALVLSVLSSLSCERVAPPAGIVFRTADIPMEPFRTRTLLDAPDIETKVTGITLAAYSEGALAESAFFTGNFGAMTLDLDPAREYTVYALVNMGDRKADLPDTETGMETVSYQIPSYTDGEGSLNSRGLPMAGKLSYDGRTTVIPVKRLLARVTASVSCEWNGAAIRSVKVYNLNRMLRPFGTGAAASPDEILDGQEFQEGTGTATGTFVFYVPENRQGTISGITSSSGKSPDRNQEVQARSDRLTYLETLVEGTGCYSGSITYRSYLGSDAVSNFDICRNASYRWNLRYLADGLQESGWKKDNQMVLRELSLEPAQATLVTGYTKTYAAYLTERTLRDGVEESRTTRLDVKDLDWLSEDTGKAVIQDGAVTGISPGTVRITATLKSDSTIRAQATLTVTEGTGGIDDGWDEGDEQILN